MLNSYKTLINGIATAVNALKSEVKKLSGKVEDVSDKLANVKNNDSDVLIVKINYNESGEVTGYSPAFEDIYNAAIAGKAVVTTPLPVMFFGIIKFTLISITDTIATFSALQHESAMHILYLGKGGYARRDLQGFPDADMHKEGDVLMWGRSSYHDTKISEALGIKSSQMEVGKVLQLSALSSYDSSDKYTPEKWMLTDLPQITTTIDADSTDEQGASAKAVYNKLKSLKTNFILNSSTSGSSKQFKITVDDEGTISATEVTTS